MSVLLLSCLLPRYFINIRWVMIIFIATLMISSVFVVATMFDAMAELLT
jgi:hypothetical protein